MYQGNATAQDSSGESAAIACAASGRGAGHDHTNDT
jgi:hypothetical protein